MSAPNSKDLLFQFRFLGMDNHRRKMDQSVVDPHHEAGRNRCERINRARRVKLEQKLSRHSGPATRLLEAMDRATFERVPTHTFTSKLPGNLTSKMLLLLS